MTKDVTAMLEGLINGPKPWLVTITYDDGATRTLRQPREAQARNFAARSTERMGRDLICSETGATIRVASVTGVTTVSKIDVETILTNHKLWVDGEGGNRADLSNADLRAADLSNADLRGADLSNADLRGADLRGADLRGADLSNADLRAADLRGADLRAGLKAAQWIGCATRGDFHVFHCIKCDNGEFFYFAGCRAMTRAEYDSHIALQYPKTDKARRTINVMDYLESLA